MEDGSVNIQQELNFQFVTHVYAGDWEYLCNVHDCTSCMSSLLTSLLYMYIMYIYIYVCVCVCVITRFTSLRKTFSHLW